VVQTSGPAVFGIDVLGLVSPELLSPGHDAKA
jgi:hypothetical protein